MKKTRLLTLSTNVAELGESGVEQAILLQERGFVSFEKCLLVSCFHV